MVDHEHIREEREGEHFMVHILELRDFYRINPQSYAVTKTTLNFFYVTASMIEDYFSLSSRSDGPIIKYIL